MRDGCCHTDQFDAGSHVICAKVTVEFLNFQMERGNDLITARPEQRFRGLKPRATAGASAPCAGVRPTKPAAHRPVVLESTHAKALEYVLLDWLRKNAVTPRRLESRPLCTEGWMSGLSRTAWKACGG